MHLTVEAQKRVAAVVSEGAIAIDATAGNGGDTLFLAQRVGPQGSILSMDIQSDAIQRVRERLHQVDLLDRVRMVCDDHANLLAHLPETWRGAVACAMFNLGYLPLSDHSVVTRAESTLPGLSAVTPFLKPGGMLSILAYVGHPGGREEAEAVAGWIQSQSDRFSVDTLRDAENPNSPILWSLTHRPEALGPRALTNDHSMQYRAS